MSATYNEIEPHCVEWLRNLIAAGHVCEGVVDGRSIRDLVGDGIRTAQAHFFAGVGVWSAALRDAGWPDDAEVWTGSCPCQPFSSAGRRRGVDDDRHLWPEWVRLISECRPPVIFGEQVSGKDGLAWLDLVHADLEGAGYAVGALDTCAAGVGAPHLRQRLYFVAVADGERLEEVHIQLRERRSRQTLPEAGRVCPADALGDPELDGRGARWLGEPHRRSPVEPDRSGSDLVVGDSGRARTGRHAGALPSEEGSAERQVRRLPHGAVAPGATRGHWRDVDWLYCRDGKARPVEPGTFPLAHGVAGRVGRLRAYGNAIVRQQASAFVSSAIDVILQ